ncbi:MAG: alpha-hydroxy-acid oxidizing protein [SAR324 cluster bacterium]|nr:alpha-hydroxy-acid oxidizing protein [SAR324 cluster bacterium]
MTEQYYEYDGPFLNLHEVIQAARLNLAQGPWEYITGGSETETTVRRNRLAFDKLAIRPRISELSRLGKITDTGRRRRNTSGKSAIVWKAS